jgi:hypothetical protein
MTGQTIEQERVATDLPLPANNVPATTNGHARRHAVERADTVGVNLLSVLSRLTEKLDPSLDIDKLKSMLEVSKELMAERARLAFLRDRALMREELPTVDADGVIMMKGSTIKARNFYAEQDSIVEACAPVMGKYGFTHDYSFWQDEKSGMDRVWVTVTLAHEEGHTVTSQPMAWPIMRTDSMNAAQQIATSISYGVRYGFKAVVPYVSHAPLTKEEFERRRVADQRNPPGRAIAKGDDTDGQASSEAPGFERPRTITDAQRKELVAELDRTGIDKLKVLEKYQIADMSKFPADKFKTMMDWLKTRVPATTGMIPAEKVDPHVAWENKVLAFLGSRDLDEDKLMTFNSETCEPMEGVVSDERWQRVSLAFGKRYAEITQKGRRVAQR